MFDNNLHDNNENKENIKNERLIIKDPLYKKIFIEPEHIKYIDSKYFQRLRYIKQTTFVDFVYPNANHTRFSHSVGVYNLMKKVLSNGLIEVSKKDREDLLLAALLHDIGHGPFSHFWESVFKNFDHEKTTRKILEELNLSHIGEILKGNHPLYYLISSTIDVDKLDYMARDSYFAGVSYGVSEVDFIIEHMYFKQGKLVIKPSAVSSIEDLITQRVNLFKTVYYHKFSQYYEFLAENIFKRVKYLIDNDLYQEKNVSINKDLFEFFKERADIDNLLNLNDCIVLNDIFSWQNSTDKILSSLSKMFVQRDKKFKIYNLNYQDFSEDKIEIIKKKIAKKYDLDYYFRYLKLPIKIIQTPIYVDFGNEIKKLSEISELIKFYETQKWFAKFLIIPKDIEI